MSKSTFTPKSDSPVDNSEHENKSEASTVGHDIAPSFTITSSCLTRGKLRGKEVVGVDIEKWVDETLGKDLGR